VPSAWICTCYRRVTSALHISMCFGGMSVFVRKAYTFLGQLVDRVGLEPTAAILQGSREPLLTARVVVPR